MACTREDHERLKGDPASAREILSFQGVQKDQDGTPLFEMHMCSSCGSTIALPVGPVSTGPRTQRAVRAQ